MGNRDKVSANQKKKKAVSASERRAEKRAKRKEQKTNLRLARRKSKRTGYVPKPDSD